MKVGIFGAGGFGREVLPEVRTMYPNADIVFVVDKLQNSDEKVNGHKVICLEEAISEKRMMTIAVADWKTRERITKKIEANNLENINIIGTNVVMYDRVLISPGSILCSGSIITSNIVIGKSFHCNLSSYVAHDCIIEDYVTFAPRVCCNGNVIVKRGAYLGTGSIIKQGSSSKPIIIGEGAIVGMGAVVTKDVLPNTTVVGNPARPLAK